MARGWAHYRGGTIRQEKYTARKSKHCDRSKALPGRVGQAEHSQRKDSK